MFSWSTPAASGFSKEKSFYSPIKYFSFFSTKYRLGIYKISDESYIFYSVTGRGGYYDFIINIGTLNLNFEKKSPLRKLSICLPYWDIFASPRYIWRNDVDGLETGDWLAKCYVEWDIPTFHFTLFYNGVVFIETWCGHLVSESIFFITKCF